MMPKVMPAYSGWPYVLEELGMLHVADSRIGKVNEGGGCGGGGGGGGAMWGLIAGGGGGGVISR